MESAKQTLRDILHAWEAGKVSILDLMESAKQTMNLPASTSLPSGVSILDLMESAKQTADLQYLGCLARWFQSLI